MNSFNRQFRQLVEHKIIYHIAAVFTIFRKACDEELAEKCYFYGNRLALFLQNWKLLCTDVNCLASDILRGPNYLLIIYEFCREFVFAFVLERR